MATSNPPLSAEASAPPARRSFVRRLFRVIERALAILGLFFLIYFLCFDLSVMVSGSMTPTLSGDGKPGSDYILSERISGWFARPKRWDLVAFHDNDGLLVMKRVIGLPHETVAMNAGEAVLINGEILARPKGLERIRYYRYGNLSQGNAVDTHDGYYVLGDDSVDSYDSRYNPPLQTSQFIARPWLRVWPLSRIGFVNPSSGDSH